MSLSYQHKLDTLRERGSLRRLKLLTGRDGCWVDYEGKRLLNLTSNDYLGLGGNKEVLHDFYSSIDHTRMVDQYGLGSCSSRLLAGDNAVSHQLEGYLADNYNREAALLFNSGYHVNIGILPSLFGKKDLILSDKFNHASIHDGLRLCRAKYKRFRHRDYDHLQTLLAQSREKYDRVIIVSESVFSMDGDTADLARLVELKKKFNTMLYLDEAHAVGLYGPKGLGKAEEQGVMGEVDILMGTFGKALAGLGAFVVCDRVIRDYLVNKSRSLIFTTALPPVLLSWNLFVFKKVEQMAAERIHLSKLSDRLREALHEKKLQTGGSTNIVPVIIGSNLQAMELAERLKNNGYLIFPVRPPAVPEGTSRFRLSLTADMEWHDIQELPELIASEPAC